MYDIKSYYNQAKNMVMNVSEMEAKVQEATNDEAWGASSTLMQEIAAGTFNFQNFNEIMPAIYTRFMEKEARQWREIYKALQLLEYLIKNGSERVVDDARSHVGTIKMLRNFHYIDDKGKDQGINVRNRAKEIVDLLGDVERIRVERRKAKANKTKYTGTGSDGMPFGSGGGGRYGGFGNDGYSGGGGSMGGDYPGASSRYGGSSGGYDRDDGGYSGGSSGGFRDTAARAGFDEYDAGDDEDVSVRRNTSVTSRTAAPSGSTTRASRSTTAPVPPKAAPAPAPQPVVNLIDDFDDFASPAAAPVPSVPAAAASGANKALPTLDDDFDDFVSAPISPTTTAAAPAQAPSNVPGQSAGAPKLSLMDMLAQPTQPTKPAAPAAPPAYGGMSMGMGGGMNVMSPASSVPGAGARQPMGASMAPTMGMGGARPTMGSSTPSTNSTAAKPSGGGFEDLWTMSLGSSKPSTPVGGASAGKSMQALQKEKTQAALFGGGASSGGAFGGLGSMGGAQAPAKPSGGAPMSGGDDLLL